MSAGDGVAHDVAADYEALGLARTILAQAERLADGPGGPGSRRLTLSDLAPFDQLHIGGAGSTETFLRRLPISADAQWLDVGSGVGGVARWAVNRYRCRVTGIDIAPGFCAVARRLSELSRMDDRVSFVEGNALAMPFADAAFDGAYTVHVGMNVEAKAALYREIGRVLKPGAAFGIYDILFGPTPGPLAYPVPWASSPATSFLETADELRALLERSGFAVLRIGNRRREALQFFGDVERRLHSTGDRRGLAQIMGAEYRRRIENSRRNVAEGRCAPFELVCRRR